MKKKGFTLIEMLIVIIIIGILAIALIPRIGGARNRANDTARISDVRSIATALIQYGLDYPRYPVGEVHPAVNGKTLFTTGATNGEVPQHDNACTINSNDLKDSTYGLGGIIPNDPVSSHDYNYRLLDSRDDHFVICAKLSDGSKQGNAAVNLAQHSYCPSYYNLGENNLTGNLTYSGILAQLQKTGDYYCYVG